MKIYLGKVIEEQYQLRDTPKEGFKEIDVKDDFFGIYDDFNTTCVGWQTLLKEIDRKA